MSTWRVFRSAVLAAMPLVILAGGQALAADAPAADAPPAFVGQLWPERSPIGDGQFEPLSARISVFRPTAKNTGAAVIICPGGGYTRLMVEPEGQGIARWLNRHGIAGIVLEYRMPGGRPLVPLLDAQRAIRLVRSRAADWQIDPRRIGIMGFSAGGHVASTAGTHFDAGDPQAADPIDRASCRPDFMLLVYPVTTLTIPTRGNSRLKLLGPEPSDELVRQFSNEQQVTDQTPPAFLAHAVDDEKVPLEHSRLFAKALRAHHVAAELLELPNGGHGLNGYRGPSWDAWQKRSIEWLSEQGLLRKGD